MQKKLPKIGGTFIETSVAAYFPKAAEDRVWGLFKKYLTIGQWGEVKKVVAFWVPTLISFKVVPLCLYTHNPAVIPLLEAFLEVLCRFGNGYQLLSYILY